MVKRGAALAAAMFGGGDRQPGSDAEESVGFDAVEPGKQPTAEPADPPAAPPAFDIRSLASRRRARLVEQPPATSSAKAGPVPAPIVVAATTCQFIKAFVRGPHMTDADVETLVKQMVPKDMHSRLRFRHAGPGCKFRECDLCGVASNAPDPVFGAEVFCIWAHKDPDAAADVAGFICVWCGYPAVHNI